MNEKPSCPKCNAVIVGKNGNARAKQWFKCKQCNFQVVSLRLKVYPLKTQARVIELYNHALSIRAAAKLQGVFLTSALNWIREFARKNYEQPASCSAIRIEFD